MTTVAAVAIVLAVLAIGGAHARRAGSRQLLGRDWVVPVAGVVAISGRSHPLVVMAAAAASSIVLLWSGRRRARAEGRRCERDVATLAYALAAELRAGQPPPAALRAAAGQLLVLGDHVRAVADLAGRGEDGTVPLRRLAERPGCARLRAVAAVWSVTAATGSRVADVLDNVGAAIEAEEQAADELAALFAGPRATVVVLAALPVAGLLLATAAGLHPLPLLVGRPVGRLLLAVAAVLDVLGLLLMRRIAMPRGVR